MYLDTMQHLILFSATRRTLVLIIPEILLHQILQGLDGVGAAALGRIPPQGS